MKVFINGKIKSQGMLNEIMAEVIDNMTERLGVPKGTEIAIDGVEFKVIFKINGQEQYATVPREINGEVVNEIFMVSVHLDDEGNIIGTDDNEEESFYDGYTLAKSIGQEYQYTGTNSKYSNEELEIVESLGDNTSTDVMSVKYIVKANPEIEVVRHYKGDILVAEYEYKPKENRGD